MAINYKISYTFAPNTTISSTQVNQNFADNVNVWTGIESLSTTFAKLKVDVDPATALEVATKQYVDHYGAYRRPVLQYNSGTIVNTETGIDGTSGNCRILFPDGNLRTDTVAGRLHCNLAQVAALSGSAQSGLRTGAAANNSWYSVYAVKTGDNNSNFVAVADLVLPLQANYSTLNANFGTNSWIYLGMIRYGDNVAAPAAIINFTQCGAITLFRNACSALGTNIPGTNLGSNSAASSLTYSYSPGYGAAQTPTNLTQTCYVAGANPGSTANITITGSSGSVAHAQYANVNSVVWFNLWMASADGIKANGPANSSFAINIAGYMDSALGVGSNPIL